ncbi:Rho-binding antiterminator [Marinomonas sp. MED121]|uniref:Rho-binding antiterminator n=1 Tax=Marinomonas sp. MED121 TaxID=314277 RepID=UPI001F5F701F|nr:Rho-binding antiterminator [Marinomonas sp. MED121]
MLGSMPMMTCEQHDYIELACVYLYEINLTLRNGDQVKGQALDTLYNDDKEACLCIKQGEEVKLVVLDQIVGMRACQENPHFHHILFD